MSVSITVSGLKDRVVSSKRFSISAFKSWMYPKNFVLLLHYFEFPLKELLLCLENVGGNVNKQFVFNGIKHIKPLLCSFEISVKQLCLCWLILLNGQSQYCSTDTCVITKYQKFYLNISSKENGNSLIIYATANSLRVNVV